MEINKTFLKLKVINDFLKTTSEIRNILLNECVEQGGTNPVILMRRFRMLSQLSKFESDSITKVYNVDVDNIDELMNGVWLLLKEIDTVTNRNS